MKEKVMHLMRRGSITCRTDASIREVSQIMMVNRSRYCIVVDEAHEVAGIISARSILKAYGLNLDETKARDILLPHTITITPHTDLAQAVSLMARKRIEHLVVVSDRPGSKAVLGILSAGDIVSRMSEHRGETR
jgi:CBS domain-containing protein